MPAAFDLMAAAFDSIAAVFDPNTAALNQMPQNKFIPQHLLFALHKTSYTKALAIRNQDLATAPIKFLVFAISTYVKLV